MKMKYFGVLILMLGVLVGCDASKKTPQDLPNPLSEPAAETISVDSTAVESEIQTLSLAEFEKLGVKVVRGDEGSVKSIDFSPLTDADARKSVLSPTRTLQSAEEIKTVRVVRGSYILSDELAANFEQASDLTELLWTDALVTDEALAKFLTLKKLKKLRLTNFAVERVPKWAEILATYPALIDLDISGSTAADADMTALAAAPKLTKLNLYQTKIGDAGVKNLLPLADRLTSLNLDATDVTDEGAKTLEAFEKLTFVHLGRTAITDNAAESLAKITTLEKLHVTRTKMTEKGFAVLKEKLPNTEVVTETEN